MWNSLPVVQVRVVGSHYMEYVQHNVLNSLLVVQLACQCSSYSGPRFVMRHVM